MAAASTWLMSRRSEGKTGEASAAATPLPPQHAGKYRAGQPYLFQAVLARLIPSRLPDGSACLWDSFGPTHRYVDLHSGWPWSRPGGDWVDANLVRYGDVPWFSAPVGDALGATAVRGYQVDVTSALRHCFSARRWCAFLLISKNAPRTIAGVRHPTESAPYIDVTYSNGQQARLACRILAVNQANSSLPSTTTPTCGLPAFSEFARPRADVASATLNFVVTEHWSGSNPVIEGYLLDPPVNSDRVRQGVAAQAGSLDEGLASKGSIIGVHRYLDGTVLSDFAHPEPINFNAERNFDPAIYATGPQDLRRLPHLGLGKWINTSDDWSLISSSYSREGFAPLAPGLGALRLRMPAARGVTDGSVVGSAGTLAGNAMIYLPEPLFGRLGRIFVRYYFRLGAPYQATVANRRHVYHVPGDADWTTYAGKFGIAPDHSTSTGGVSGTSGGGHGWQMRHSWYDCDAGTSGPDEGGWAVGYHLYDFYQRNPPGHNYGHADGSTAEQQWGQRGGLGVLYAGQWYCVETELKLNTVLPGAPGYLADGELRTWIDGRLAYERKGMVFRTTPIADLPYAPDQLRPCRELGVRGLWLNWFHGGKTVSTFDRTTFYTGLVWGREYVGPMKT